jgi:hypothetical protein
MLRVPVSSDVEPTADPDTVVALNVIEEACQAVGACGSPSQSAMEPD